MGQLVNPVTPENGTYRVLTGEGAGHDAQETRTENYRHTLFRAK